MTYWVLVETINIRGRLYRLYRNSGGEYKLFAQNNKGLFDVLIAQGGFMDIADVARCL